MGGADGVDVEGLARQNVPLDLLRRHGVAVFGAGVVVVHPVELDLAAIDEKDIPPDLHRPEADAFPDTGGGRLVADGIEDWLLRVPLRHGEIVKDGLRVVPAGGYRFRFGEAVPLDGERHLRVAQGIRFQGQAVGGAGFLRRGVNVREIRGIRNPQ